MSEQRLKELLQMRLEKAKVLAGLQQNVVEDTRRPVVHSADETREQREARLMRDDAAWSAFGGNSRSILPQ